MWLQYVKSTYKTLQFISENNYYFIILQVSYRNTSTHDPFLLQIPGCDSIACDLDQFIDILKPISLSDWYEECHKDYENNALTYFCKLNFFVY